MVQLLATSVSGTSPTLTVRIQHSGDNRNWMNLHATAEVNAAALSNDAQFSAEATAADELLAYVRLAISLGGTSPACRLTAYASGRDM